MANKKKLAAKKEEHTSDRTRPALKKFILIVLPAVLFFQIVFATRLFLSETWRARGNAFRQTGQIAQSRQLFEHAQKYDPKDYKTLHLLGASLVASGDYTQAADILRQCLRWAPHHPLALDLTAIVHLQQGNLDKATEAITHAKQIAPTSPYMHSTSARILVAENRYDEAVVEFQNALQFLRQSPRLLEANRDLEGGLLRMMADIYHKNGQIEMAITTASEALNKNPDEPVNYVVKGQLLALAGQWRETATILQQALTMLETFPSPRSLQFQMRSHMELARAYTELDEPVNAVVQVCMIQKLNVAVSQFLGLLDPIKSRLDPKSPAYHLVQGWTLMQTPQPQEAAGELQQAIVLMEQDDWIETENAQVIKASAHFNLATVFLELDRLTNATQQVFEVQKLESKDPRLTALIETIADRIDADSSSLSIQDKAKARLLLSRSLVVAEQKQRGYETLRRVAENSKVPPHLRAAAYAERARLLAGLDRKFTEALSELDRAEQIDPTLSEIKFVRRYILESQRRTETQQEKQPDPL